MTNDALIDELISRIFEREGRKYENVKNDRGGPTKYGITLGRLRTERGRHMTWQHVRDLTEDDAREIYRDAYFRRPRIDQLPDSIVEFVFDGFVTSGTWSIKFLQEVLRDAGFEITVDGEVGIETIEAAEMAVEAMGKDLLRAIVIERTHFFGRIVAGREDQGKFIRGWVDQRAHAFWRAI